LKPNNNWVDKTARRREMKGEANSITRRTYRDGRRNRKVLANNGAFGNLDGRAYNLCALGTHSTITKKQDD
jgi:hypothetical protein